MILQQQLPRRRGYTLRACPENVTVSTKKYHKLNCVVEKTLIWLQSHYELVKVQVQ